MPEARSQRSGKTDPGRHAGVFRFSRDARPRFTPRWVAGHGGSPAEVVMPQPALSAAVASARNAVARPPDADATDGQLLARFVLHRDEAAFAELVRRLGPMVLDVRPREAVRGWLYGVAVRVAREARSVFARRRTREVCVPAVPDRAAELTETPDADALRVLDEEVAALPDHLRAAVVLCELGGASRTDAAERLGVPEGTLSSRLAKARKLLADRLRK